MTRGEIFDEHAQTWRQVPFHWQGRVRSGADCKGWIVGAAKELGFPEADSLWALAGDYGPIVPIRRLRQGLADLFDPVAERARGDLLLLKVGGKPQHLAVASPRDGRPSRALQAWHTGPRCVVASGVPRDWVDSIWRWRD